MREPLVVLDKDVRVVSANKSFCDTFRVQMSDVKNRRLYELGSRQWDNPKLRKLLGEVLPKKNYFNDFEVSFDFPEIGPKTMVLNGRQIKLHGKDSPLILLVIEDITKRKKAEDVLRRDNKTLDQMINKRSKELLRLQEKLVRARHLSAIGTLAATVAHELRNPLADIAVSTHRIKKISKDRVVEKILNGINARVLESNQIITDILSYSKTVITHFEPVQINDILKVALDEEAQNPRAARISIHKKIDRTKDLSIDADPARLKEVFRNVLHNAVDAVQVDTGRIELDSDVRNSVVVVRIKDNGEGIAKKDLKNVVRPFFTTKAKGTGLGLAVSKQVVVLHGGSITFKSVKGKGTTVEVTLPVQRQKDA
jgi:two-component system CheB/CheR fusion protein